VRRWLSLLVVVLVVLGVGGGAGGGIVGGGGFGCDDGGCRWLWSMMTTRRDPLQLARAGQL
jgi:hypothetical protein